MSRIIETITIQIPPDPWITDPEIENLCCEVIDMPVCKEKIEPWRGYTQEEILERLNLYVDDSGRDADGNIVEVRLKNDNPSGLCGEQVTKQIEKPKACCDGVTQIVWDDAKSVEVIADNSDGYVYVTGGRPPYTWSVRGHGFWFNSVGTIRDAETDEPWIRIFTINSCGPCTVTVTDGCSEVTGYVRSDVGSWGGVTEIDDCLWKAPNNEWANYDVHHIYNVKGKFMQIQELVGEGGGGFYYCTIGETIEANIPGLCISDYVQNRVYAQCGTNPASGKVTQDDGRKFTVYICGIGCFPCSGACAATEFTLRSISFREWQC